ncbi:thioredoxin-like protein [Cokeromyces recurvatus]|uniref:thioredoxin-like protein n=1 Tax=Cokeromyces recurvatus TaxID=90255 RepID=UPI00221F557B|nr:thioredoxin-like protein [Cokeromyces recurvatus]KAI7897617.1 thioredoxin-like protein [Cokeromyces recurvatus]
MSFFKKLFFLLIAVNAAFLGYDYYQGGQIAFNLVENAKQLNKDQLHHYVNELKSITPEKIAGQVNNAFAQLQNVNSLSDILELVREKTSPILKSSNTVEHDGNVLVLTDANFKQLIDGSKPALVEFYAPWCGHCKNLAPIYSQLADAFAHQKENVIIAKLDADQHRETGSAYGIQGFPTLKWFPKGVHSPEGVEDYKGARDLNSLASFVQQKSGIAPRIRAQKSNVVELNSKNFHEIVFNPKKHVFVEFYASWCGHCKNLAPIWERLGHAFANEPNVVIAKINAADEADIGQEFDIEGYPTIKLFPAGESTPFAYSGARSEAAFISFLNEHTGTKRKVGGGLESDAGRIPELDELAIRFMTHQKEKREEIQKEAQQFAKELGTRYANYYAKIMEKMLVNGDKFLDTEKQRLSKILKSDDVSSSKLDDFNIRQNILASFDKKATPVAV